MGQSARGASGRAPEGNGRPGRASGADLGEGGGALRGGACVTDMVGA